jgi:hypothetical protein
VQVTVDVDFGDRPRVVRTVAIERGTDVVTATRAALPVEQDWLCCSPQDVWSIGGAGPDPRLDRYWSWRLGADVFVAPVVVEGATHVNGTLPPAQNGWASYWNAAAPVLPGGAPFDVPLALNESAVFVRAGALLPLHVSTPLALVPEGGAAFAGAVTLFAHAPDSWGAGSRADSAEALIRVGGGCLAGNAEADARCVAEGGARAALSISARAIEVSVSAFALAAAGEAGEGSGNATQGIILYVRGGSVAARARS